MRRRRGVLLLAAVLAALSAPAWSAVAGDGGPLSTRDPLQQCGTVRSGDTPLGSAEVTLYEAGDRRGGPATPLATTRSDAQGRFQLSYGRPSNPAAVLYLIADVRRGGRDGGRHGGPVRLAAVLGTPGPGPDVVINERTTVATAYAMAQFTDGADISGSRPGLRNAAAISHNLADVTTGEVARLLDAPPNGPLTSTLRTFNSLADLLAGCVDGTTCRSLLGLAQQPGKPAPEDTLQAAVDIAHAPGNHVGELFALAVTKPLYEPALSAAPDAWTLALRYDGNGHELNGPGNIAFDADGNAWVTNNYRFDADPHASVCGDDHILRFTPTGQDAPGAPYRGGGLYGAGFGITLDPKGDVWAGNFGFQGSGCALDPSRFYRSVSQFGPTGRALSPRRGWRSGDIVQPQGTVSDRDGNIWIANCGGRSVTRIPQGHPEQARSITPPADALVKPFDIAVDPAGQAWVTGNGSESVVMLSPDGTPTRSVTGGGLSKPLGIASDSLGNLWVANSGVVPLPCEDGTSAGLADAVQNAVPGAPGASVTMIRPDGTTPDQPFSNAGLVLPWGVAVDGDDTVWVANFGGQRLVRLCGARLSSCPPGSTTGQPISPPDTGYTSDGLVRNTGVQIDPSGNVWLANNWQTVPFQTNPGGHELVVFIGLAAPVRAPLIGPPQQP
ncbi:NHL repeat-containing protein [Kitasatospora mediocidica]|uniref:NHL repeat containing protein n=1 Tax=Kitasatospora mediocidica TaxID=58352 RepID=UPI000567F69A|nr:NHL repeat containing protein [Kitasatospora mediocidica]